MDGETEIGLVSVNVGRPRVIGNTRFGKPIRSGIIKHPATSGTLYLDTLNLAGDRQADLTVHGGPDKAVYAYPSEHLAPWNDELGTAFGIGTFGENLTTSGWLEDEVRIGDIWAWGDARLQVSQPRSPCYKLATVTGRPDLLKRFVRSGRTGWYLRVLQPGIVPMAGPLRVIARDPAAISVLDAHRAMTTALSDQELEAVASVPALAAAWREPLHERLRQAELGSRP
ncbi:MAG: MOSC domain-containing protein [Chloroflexia bacterium]|nr:MOSC domain-containing protein [Chloroflexia bacterium]